MSSWDVSIPKTKVIKQPVQQPGNPTTNGIVRTAIKPIAPQKPLPNQRISKQAFENSAIMYGLMLCIVLDENLPDRHSEATKKYSLTIVEFLKLKAFITVFFNCLHTVFEVNEK